MNRLASAIVVNWNGLDLLEDCLTSLLAQTYTPLEVILVDNGSTDGSVDWVPQRFGDRVRVVALPENLGFAGGNNAGFDAARGDYLVLLNNDAVADSRWIEAMVAAVEADSGLGGCTSKILIHDDPGRLDSTGLFLYPDGSARGRGRLEQDRGQYEVADEVAAPSGCACLYRREAVEQAQGFDAAFFCFCEDVDLGLRCRLAGWRFAYVPAAVVHHKGSSTVGEYSARKAYLVERNRLWVMLKTYPAVALLTSLYFTAARYGWNVWAVARGRGTAGRFSDTGSVWALAWIVLRAHAATLRHAPRLLRERRRLARMRGRGPHPLREWLGDRALSPREFTQIE